MQLTAFAWSLTHVCYACMKRIPYQDNEGYIAYMKMIRFFEKDIPDEEPQKSPAPTEDDTGSVAAVAKAETETVSKQEATGTKPPTSAAALSSPRRNSAAVAAAVAASQKQTDLNNSRRSLNNSRRSLNSSVRSNNSYNYDDSDFDSDDYENDFSDDDDEYQDDDDDVLSRSKRLSMSKVESNTIAQTEDFAKLSSKLAAVPAEKARQLRAAINAAAQVKFCSPSECRLEVLF